MPTVKTSGEEPLEVPALETDSAEQTAKRVYFFCLAYTLLGSLFWFCLVLSQKDGGVLFREYNITAETVAGILVVIVVFRARMELPLVSPQTPAPLTVGFHCRGPRGWFFNRRSSFQLQQILARYPERNSASWTW